MDVLARTDARTQTRTGDTCIFSAVLYQLSYPGQWELSLLLMVMAILSEACVTVK
jgi:hypothetical protein